MSDHFVRRMMLDQTWNHEKGYIKPLHFPSGNLSNTFYFTAKNQSNFHFDILGKLTQSPDDIPEMICAIEKQFHEAVNRFDDVTQVVEALCSSLDATHNGVELCFQLWSRHKDFTHIPLISIGMPMIKQITRNFENIELAFDTEPYQSQRKPTFKCTFVPIALTKYLIFATDASYLPEPSSLSESTLDSIFDLSKHLSDTMKLFRATHPESVREVTILLIDLHDLCVASEVTLHGLDDCDAQIEAILATIPPSYDPFAIKLILSELLMNAYKHGNGVDQTLPIKVIVGINSEALAIEVQDMCLEVLDLPIKTVITTENILDEHGRGLYLVNAFSDKLTIDNNSVVSRIKCNIKD